MVKIENLQSNEQFKELSKEASIAIVGGSGPVGDTIVQVGYTYGDAGKTIGSTVAGANQVGADVGRIILNTFTTTGKSLPV